jgi:uncharacterized protein (DUF4415 family)
MHTETVRKPASNPSSSHSSRREAGKRKPDIPARLAKRRNGEAPPRGKTRLTIYLDMAIVEYFRSRAGGRGYQTLINEALRQAIAQENLEDVLRRVIREESRPYQVGKAKI